MVASGQGELPRPRDGRWLVPGDNYMRPIRSLDIGFQSRLCVRSTPVSCTAPGERESLLARVGLAGRRSIFVPRRQFERGRRPATGSLELRSGTFASWASWLLEWRAGGESAMSGERRIENQRTLEGPYIQPSTKVASKWRSSLATIQHQHNKRG